MHLRKTVITLSGQLETVQVLFVLLYIEVDSLELSKMDLNLGKVVALLVLALVSFVTSLILTKVRKVSKFFRAKNDDKKDSILSVIQSFAGGILFGTAIILILPEVSSKGGHLENIQEVLTWTA